MNQQNQADVPKVSTTIDTLGVAMILRPATNSLVVQRNDRKYTNPLGHSETMMLRPATNSLVVQRNDRKYTNPLGRSETIMYYNDINKIYEGK